MKRHHKFITVGTAVYTITLLSVLSAITSYALPQNGAVVGGSATISQPNPTTMNINQTSGNAIINWQGYSIGANEAVKYIQPGSNSIALNRVTGVDPSSIYGLLSGNGQVWVINPNGLLVGPGATVQTGSFLASTMSITNENFLSGKHLFTNTPGSQASIVNQGNISAANGGYVVLAAPSVTNSGSIVANMGTVHLASGDTVTLSLDNGSLINVAVNGDVAADALGVTNSGVITAAGGKVILTARVAGDIMKNIVNNSGTIEAQSIIEKNGEIILDGGDYGISANSGTLDASGKKSGESGGTIKILGDRVALFAGSAIDASGDTGGGTVLIGGNFHGAGTEQNASMTYVDKDATIKADALVNGDGGKVAVWADDATKFYGTISARGGSSSGNGGGVETSGKQQLIFKGSVDTRAPNGKTGTLLLDPTNVTIDDVGPTTPTYTNVADTFADDGTSPSAESVLLNTDLQAALGAANITVSTASAGGSAGTILVSAPVTWNNSNGLTLSAESTISINAAINGGATSSLTLNAGGPISQSASGIITTGTLHTTAVGGTALNTAINAVSTFISSDSGAISLNNTAATLSLGAISGTGATINTSGNLKLTDTINVGGGALGLTYGQDGTGRTLDLSTTGPVTAGTIIATGAGGIDTLLVSDNAAAITLTPASYVGSETIALSNIENAIISGGAGNNNINVSAWNGSRTASINITAASDTVTGNGANTTLIGSNTASTFTITGPNLGNVNNTTTFSGVGNLVGGSGADTFELASGVATFNGSISGGGGIDTLAATNGTNAWQSSGANAGTLNTTTAFSAITNLVGGSGADTFTLAAGIPTFNGSVAGGGGIDTLAATNGTNAWQSSSANTGTLNTTTAFSAITNLTGGSGTDTLTGRNATNAWDISGANAASVDGMTATSMQALVGGSGADTFTLAAGIPTFNGSVAGGGGIDTLAATNGTNAWQSSSANTGTLNTTTAFSAITNLTGGSGTDTLTGRNATNAWDISGANAASVDGMTATSMQALVGGSGADTFTLAAGIPTFNGSVAGGGGIDTLAATNGTNAWQSSSANTGTLNTTTAFSAITNLTGGSGTDTLTGRNATNAWDISGANAASVDGMTATSMQALVGGSGADTFTLAAGIPTFNGSVAGGGGIDTLAATNGTNAWQSSSANTGTLNTTTAFSAITNLTGGSGTDTLTGRNATNAWDISGANAASVDGMTATSMQALVGGSGADTFTLAAGIPTFNGSVAGGGGIDTLAATNGTNAWQSSSANTGTLNTTTAFSAITNLTGGSGTDTLTGRNATNAWDISGANAASVDGMTATSMQALVGGSGADTFTLAAGIPTFNGSVAGGGGIDTLAATNGTNAWQSSGANAGTLNTTTAFSAITNLTGGSGTDTLTGRNATNAWDISGANAASVDGMTATSMQALVGGSGADTFTLAAGIPTFNGSVAGGGGIDTLAATNGTNAWQSSSANTGTLNTTTAFSAITNLTGGSGTDTLTGRNATNAWDISGANAASVDGMTATSMQALVGGSGADTFTLAAGIPTFNGSVAGGGGIDTLAATNGTNAWQSSSANTGTLNTTTAFSAITNLTGGSGTDTLTGRNATNAWDISGANAASVDGMTATSMQALVGGSGADTFTLAAGIPTFNGSVAGGGGIDTLAATNGTNAWQSSSANTGTLNGTTTFSGITNLTGGADTDTLTGTDQTYTLDDSIANKGSNGAVSWISFEKIVDSGVGTIETIGGQTYNLTGPNSGEVPTLLPGGYEGIGNLTDSGAGNFTFGPNGRVSGDINAAGGTLDYAGFNDVVNINLAGTVNSTTGIGGVWNGIANIIGSNGNLDTIGGSNAVYNLTAANAGNSGTVAWTSFENLHDTAAGIFKFDAGGSVSGGITATGGTLDYSAMTGPVTVDLTAHTAPGIGTNWNGIATLAGSIYSDIITGSGQTYNLTGVDAGNNGSTNSSTSWSSFENVAGTGSNSYLGAAGSSLSGSISNTADAVTVQGTIQTGGSQTYAGTVTLAGSTAMTSSGSGDITFGGTVDSDATPRDLMIGTSGATTFAGTIGTTPLNSLTINAGGTTHINGGAVTTSGATGQAYNNAVMLGIDTILNAGTGAITEGSTGSITTTALLTTLSGSGQNLVGNGANAIAAFNATNTTSGDINLTNAAQPLTITGINQSGGGLNITNSGAVTSTGPLTVSGATSISSVGQPITLANVDNDFGGPVTVTGAATSIADKNDLAVVMHTTGPTTITAGADLTLSGTSTDAVIATALDKVTLSNPSGSILQITGSTIAGTMNNASPLDLTTSGLAPVTVNLKGELPFLTLVGDIKTQIRSLGLYNGAIVMGSEMDHYKEAIDLRSTTTALAVNAERFGTMGMLEYFYGFFNIAPTVSSIDDSQAFNVPEEEPELIDF